MPMLAMVSRLNVNGTPSRSFNRFAPPRRLMPALQHRTCSVLSLQPSRLAISLLRRPCATKAGMPAITSRVRIAGLVMKETFGLVVAPSKVVAHASSGFNITAVYRSFTASA